MNWKLKSNEITIIRLKFYDRLVINTIAFGNWTNLSIPLELRPVSREMFIRSLMRISQVKFGVIHLVHTENLSKYEKLIFLTALYAHVHDAYQSVGSVNFSENFKYVLNGY